MSWCSRRASATFCWLPPDSSATRPAAGRARASRAVRATATRRAPAARAGDDARTARRGRDSVRFSATDQAEREPFLLPVLREQSHRPGRAAPAGAPPRVASRHRRAPCPLRTGVQAEQRPEQLGAPRAHQARRCRGSRRAAARARRRAGSRTRDSASISSTTSPGAWGTAGRRRVERAADHGLDDVRRWTSAAASPGTRRSAPVPQHREPVGDAPDLLEEVADVDDGHAARRASAGSMTRTAARSPRRQRAGRLVHDDDPRVSRRAPGRPRRAAGRRGRQVADEPLGRAAPAWSSQLERLARRAARIARRRTTPRRSGSRPSTMFCSTVRCGASVSSW